MKRILAIGLVALLGGCAAVKDAGEDAIDSLTNPPAEVWDQIVAVLTWLAGLFVDFFADLASMIGL